MSLVIVFLSKFLDLKKNVITDSLSKEKYTSDSLYLKKISSVIHFYRKISPMTVSLCYFSYFNSDGIFLKKFFTSDKFYIFSLFIYFYSFSLKKLSPVILFLKFPIGKILEVKFSTEYYHLSFGKSQQWYFFYKKIFAVIIILQENINNDTFYLKNITSIIFLQKKNTYIKAPL